MAPPRLVGHKRRCCNFLLGLSGVYCTLFVAYIVHTFLIKPASQWRSVSYYGKSSAGAAMIGLHWVGGMIVLLLGTLQLVPEIRSRWPRFHKIVGYTYISACIITSVAGFSYICKERTVGGLSMDISFIIYGLLFLVSEGNQLAVAVAVVVTAAVEEDMTKVLSYG
eukprot:TRINITY_DN130_c1_g2_i2.p1 TRINITY_DN130_c1_g2~~TRINITY_DN130_c1_g2_i2.p1  ORF type:complete len:166 (-),score=8.13 TRINITY_DN130_c1_g2_i2:285-782(-)